MPNTPEVQAFFATRLKQPQAAHHYAGKTTVIVRLTGKDCITFPVRKDGNDCFAVTVLQPLPGKLTIAQLIPLSHSGPINVKYFDKMSFATAKSLNLPGRTVAIDYDGDVRMAGPNRPLRPARNAQVGKSRAHLDIGKH